VTRKPLLIAVAAVVVAGTPLVSYSEDRKAGGLTIEPYVFEAGGEKVDAELGRLVVPENRRDPNSSLIDVAFVRFKSTAAKPGSPIVYLAGGPGGSGIGAARGSRFPLFMALREIADVIALDQRATGMSRPSLECTEPLNYPLDKPAEPAEMVRLYQERADTCVRVLKAKGMDVRGYNTNESADDLDDLRKALGADKISLWGISYGTHLALTTIRRHEGRIDRVILAGIEGPAHTWKLPSTIQQHLEKISRLSDADPRVNDKVPDLMGLMRTMLERLEKEPLVVDMVDPRTRETVGVTLGRFDLQEATASVVGNSEVANIPAFYYALANGNTSHALVKRFARDVGRARMQGIGPLMPLAMDCASGAEPGRLELIEREARATLLGSAIDFPFPGVCVGLGKLDLGAAFRAPLRSKVPALFISGTLDARTPVSNAEEVRKGFSTSTHLIIDGAVHSDPLFLSSPRIKDVMLEFMKSQPVSTTRVTATPMKFTPFLKSDPGPTTEEWEGVLEIPGQKLRLALRVAQARPGVWEGELRSVDQGNTISPVDSVEYEGSRLAFQMNSIGASYEGAINADGSESVGQWKQAAFPRSPLNFKRVARSR
jgi:pimeloyl-ACP methyl ester carboxylesterase